MKNIIRILIALILILLFAALVLGYFLVVRGRNSNPVPEITSETVTEEDTTEEITTAAPVTVTVTETETAAVSETDSESEAPAEETSYAVLSDDNIEPLPVPQTIVIDEQNYNMLLVNNRYRMPSDYTVRRAYAVDGYDIELEERVAPHYQAMYDAAKADGIYLTPYSGYRSYERQQINYANKTQLYLDQGYNETDALALAARIIMPPGSSEHNLGLAMDICGTDYDFDQTAAFAWLKAHAADYGFILRYTREKQTITKVVYEPWHWRYVGVENAYAINASGLCLEEYLSQYGGMPLTQ